MASEKVTPGEEVEKVTKCFDYMKEAVVKIRRKDLDNFDWKSIGPTGWFNLDNELKKISFLHLNRNSIICFEMNIEGQDIEPYKMFILTFDTNK